MVRKTARPSDVAARPAGPAVVFLERRLARPQPPAHLLDPMAPDRFEPADDLILWVRRTFIEEGGPLTNPDHWHLRDAIIGVLWTNAENSRAGKSVVGQAELMPPMVMGKWQKARAEQQVAGWFGVVPDFLLTFSAPYAAQCDDATFCALVEHELYHCGQATDAFGAPRFSKSTGRPVFAMRGHDVEQFVGVVRRYGVEATGVSELVEAAKQPPQISRAALDFACGTCGARAA